MPGNSTINELDALRRKSRYLEVIHEFALSQVGLDSLEDIVWNVAKTAIARLGFVDCVIYLLDEDGETLVQRAAHGPKNPVDTDIYNPITIAVGEGIVGSVAQTGQVERIENTSEDPRYILDDQMRLSELAVPIIHNDKVIGVLDSEHPDPGFFTEDHVQLLTTIASLASTRIDTALAMERLRATVERLERAERDLEAKAEELQIAKNAADRASAEKSNFLANLSHEIRTPMTSIVGYADLLTRQDRSDEEKNEWAEQVRRNADHLLGLVNDVLDLSKIEAGEFTPDIAPCEFNALIADVQALMRPHAEDKGLTLTVEVPGSVPLIIQTDAVRLRQALVNLVSNAVKYTSEGGIQLILSSEPSATTGDLEVMIDVRDSGIGISPAERERVFEPFIRSSEARFTAPGTGLGLAISREFARHSTVCVSPRHFLLAERKPGRQGETVRLDGVIVHLVEDSSAIASLIRHLVEEKGAEFRHSANGQDGVWDILAAIREGRGPDLVLMDMLMPVMDGYEAARRLREAGVEVPIVAMTAFTLTDDRDRCLAAGCDVYVTKPINPARFIGQLSACLH
jgi:signal transduction histidine kinase/CheY-like chemotaxis protein